MRRLPIGIGRGLRLEIDFQRQTKLYLGMYEIELNKQVRQLCRPGVRALDVGGQFGFYALVFAKLTGAPVVSFESDQAYAELIRKNFDCNPSLSPLLDVRHVAVGERTGDGTIALDDFAADWGVPGLIKVDVEGAEVAVLRGAARLLREFHPALVVEVHSPELEEASRELLRNAGYSVRVIDQRRLLRDTRATPHNRWLIARSETG